MRRLGEFLLPFAAGIWLIAIIVLVTLDQIALIPPAPPTPEQSALARPAALRHWRLVAARLAGRLPPEQPPPLEIGAVWATRAGEICGFVNRWNTGVGIMTPFYTVRLRPIFKPENERQYIDVWSKCRFDQWVVLHRGGYAVGACATRDGRAHCARPHS